MEVGLEMCKCFDMYTAPDYPINIYIKQVLFKNLFWIIFTKGELN